MVPQSKILTLEQATDWISARKSEGLRVGFTCGAFDLLHAGHVQYLAEARGLCDRLLVAINSDESVRRYKSPLRPIRTETERMLIVAALESVDAVVRMDEDRPLSLLLRWQPDLYIKGGDYKTETSLRSAGAVREYGGEVKVIPAEFDTSTSAILDQIATLSVHASPVAAPEAQKTGLVLLDRDGTLIRNVPFNQDPVCVEPLPGVAEGLVRLQAAGLRLAVVSNQQGINLGYHTAQDFIAANQRLFSLLGPHGIRISRVYFCPHSMADDCDCRKPAAGMILRAMRDFAVQPRQTFLIGDSHADIEAATTAGCRSVLVAGSVDFAAAADQILAWLK
jgi:rfaE bifunctional protein nucleotidyltransferase chain/domain